MKRRFSAGIAICLLLLLSSCGRTQVIDDKNNVEQYIPALSPVTYGSIPADFHCDNYAVAGRTLFLHGTCSSGPSFFCIDLDTSEKTEIELPVSGPVMNLSVSNDGLCLATVYSSRLDETKTPRGFFTLFEISPDSSIRKQVELKGINSINLLAIGTPVVNGCAFVDDDILIIVNNRVVLLDDEGRLIQHIVMDSGHPRIVGASVQPVCVYDVADGEITAKLLYVSKDNRITVEKLECPASCDDIIPTSGKENIFVVQENNVYPYDLDLQHRQEKPVWAFTYGYSGEKEYFYDGTSTLLECYDGRIAVFRIQ